VHGAHRFELPGAQVGRAHLEGRMDHDGPLRDWMDRFLTHIFQRQGETMAA
jgi:GMP synthase (glutamine-hydrolysing)